MALPAAAEVVTVMEVYGLEITALSVFADICKINIDYYRIAELVYPATSCRDQ